MTTVEPSLAKDHDTWTCSFLGSAPASGQKLTRLEIKDGSLLEIEPAGRTNALLVIRKAIGDAHYNERQNSFETTFTVLADTDDVLVASGIAPNQRDVFNLLINKQDGSAKRSELQTPDTSFKPVADEILNGKCLFGR